MIEKLTPAQEIDVRLTLEKWLKLGKKTEPLDRDLAASSVKALYKAAGKSEPKCLFFSSPMMCILAWRSLTSAKSEQTALSAAQISNHFGGTHWCAWEVFYDFCRRIGVQYTEWQNATLDLWLNQAEHCHWWFPYEGVVLLSERHNRVMYDEQGRLHSKDGLAVGYPDGWGVYAWHGVRVPENVILRPESITDSAIDSEPNAEVRRVMLERYGLDRYLTAGKVISKSGEYRLVTKSIGTAQTGQTKMVALIMRCPTTSAVYVHPVHPDVTTVDEALAWKRGHDDFRNKTAYKGALEWEK